MSTTFGITSKVDQAYLLVYEPNLSTLLATGEVLTTIIAQSFSELKASLAGKGYKHTLIPDSDSDLFKIPHAYKTLELIYTRSIKENSDRFHTEAARYYEKYLVALDEAIAQMTYDVDEDGSIEEDEGEENQYGGIRLIR